MMKYAFVILLCAVVLQISKTANEHRVKVTLFYEALCPHSTRFIREQLYDLNTKMEGLILIELVPFGRMQINQEESNTYHCTRGLEDCYANKVHVCAIEQLIVKGQNKLLEFIHCLINTKYQDKQIKQCSERTSFDYQRLKRCMVVMANDLFWKQAQKTYRYFPDGLEFIPVIMINDYFNKTLDLAATENLERTVCKFLQTNFCKQNYF